MINELLEKAKIGSEKEVVDLAYFLASMPTNDVIDTLVHFLLDQNENLRLVADLALECINRDYSIPLIINIINGHQNDPNVEDLFVLLKKHDCSDYFFDIFNMVVNSGVELISVNAFEVLYFQNFCLSLGDIEKAKKMLEIAKANNLIFSEHYDLSEYLNNIYVENAHFSLSFFTPKISKEVFNEYFSKKNNYVVEKDVVRYINKNTDVYFYLYYWVENVKLLDNFDDDSYAIFDFKMHYKRSHVYALEAAIELKNLINHFQCKKIRPNIGGFVGSEREYKNFIEAKFVKLYNKLNKYVLKNIMKNEYLENGEYYCRNSSEIEVIWNWNYKAINFNFNSINRRGEFDFISENFSPYISKIIFILFGNKLYKAVRWYDEGDNLVPKAEFVICKRKKKSENSLSNNWDTFLVPFEIAEPILKKFPKMMLFDLEAYVVNNNESTAIVSDFFKKLENQVVFSLIHFEYIINEEYLM